MFPPILDDHTPSPSRVDEDNLVDRTKAMSINSSVAPAIGTKGMFPIMDLPSELRLQIYQHLLVVPEPINIETLNSSYLTSPSPGPSVAILQTCREINQEGIPILYSQNKFIICLSIEPVPSSSLTNTVFLHRLRWSTISLLNSLSFVSNSFRHPGDGDGDDAGHLTLPRPAFVCTGAQIMGRVQKLDFVNAPWGPDQYMALRISNWISVQVMAMELKAFKNALEASRLSAEAAFYGDNVPT